MNSRDIKDLHPYLAERWVSARAEWMVRYPQDPQPFLTQTYRSFDVQNSLYDQGRSTPGKIVTKAKGGQSLHNYYPAHAFDMAFKIGDQVYWGKRDFFMFAEIIKPMGVEWGGDWIGFKDYPHFEVPNFSWRDAEAGREFTMTV